MPSKEIQDLRESTRAYLKQLYADSRIDSAAAWDRMLDIIFLYIDERIKIHEEASRLPRTLTNYQRGEK